MALRRLHGSTACCSGSLLNSNAGAAPLSSGKRRVFGWSQEMQIAVGRRCFGSVTIKVPSMGDSISEGTINEWKKSECFLAGKGANINVGCGLKNARQ